MKPLRLDPRVLLLATAVLSSLAVIAQTPAYLLLLFACALLLARLVGCDLRRIARRCLRLWQIALSIAMLQSLFAPSGQALVSLAGLPLLTLGGLAKGAVVLLRLSIFLLSGALFGSYPSGVLVQALIQIKLPYEIAYMAAICIRFVPQLAQVFRDRLTALELRGIELRALAFQKRLSVYSYLILPVIVTAIAQARELAFSMDLRGFRAYPTRTALRPLVFSAADKRAIVAVGIASVALIGLHFLLGGRLR